ncbi:hypothetical protein HU147_18440 [Planomicrobium chinense]|uniref:hypothetical protein n=1 Tax=Planococcus chinensis TaxID=272917 RepID=UPI001CC5C8F5|nr:hypothetical protein [Planococcus chinensis]MBZ5203185.1 hypothetical protein [Planococcus chinensis]
MTTVQEVELVMLFLIEEDFADYPDLIEVAQRWLRNDEIKTKLVLAHNDSLKDFEGLEEEGPSIEENISYFIEHPFLLGDTISMVGIKEFAEMIGWDKARLSTKFSRQQSGKKVRPRLPEPVQILASTPLWTKAQVSNFKRRLKSESK